MLPDAAEDAEGTGIGDYPIAYLFCVIGFLAVFFVQRVLSPVLTPTDADGLVGPDGGGTCCSQSAGAVLGKVSFWDTSS